MCILKYNSRIYVMGVGMGGGNLGNFPACSPEKKLSCINYLSTSKAFIIIKHIFHIKSLISHMVHQQNWQWIFNSIILYPLRGDNLLGMDYRN